MVVCDVVTNFNRVIYVAVHKRFSFFCVFLTMDIPTLSRVPKDISPIVKCKVPIQKQKSP